MVLNINNQHSTVYINNIEYSENNINIIIMCYIYIYK